MKLGQKSVKNLVGFLGDLKTPKIHSEINWPLLIRGNDYPISPGKDTFYHRDSIIRDKAPGNSLKLDLDDACTANLKSIQFWSKQINSHDVIKSLKASQGVF